MERLEELLGQVSEEMKKLELITINEAADRRGVTRSAIVQLIRRGRLPSYRIFTREYVKKSDVLEFKELPRGRR